MRRTTRMVSGSGVEDLVSGGADGFVRCEAGVGAKDRLRTTSPRWWGGMGCGSEAL